MDNKNSLVIFPDSWSEAKELFSSNPQFIFRGQANAQWGLSTKLERICWRNDYPTTFLANRERVMLHEFQRRAHHYINDLPDLNNKLEWYALMQHYGAATRLLDFTQSFYIAAFFAIESATTHAAVWALNDDYLYQHTDNTIRGGDQTIYDLYSKSREIVENNLSHRHIQKIVMATQPERLNERIYIQQGLFAIPGDVECTFEDNLSETLEMKDNEIISLKNSLDDARNVVHEVDDYLDHGIIKVILHRDIQNEAMRDLGSMNINSATLFPGLEGFSNSLNLYLRDVC